MRTETIEFNVRKTIYEATRPYILDVWTKKGPFNSLESNMTEEQFVELVNEMLKALGLKERLVEKTRVETIREGWTISSG